MERVYVGNLPPDIRIKDIDDFFRPFGKLVAIDVNNRSNPAFAFVQFDSQRNALSAVRNRHGYDYEGYTLQVKLVENNVGSFEVRNQNRQITPPPPPPMFNNDFNNQNQMGGGFGNNFGRNSGSFGGNNFGSNNFGNDFNNLSSSSSFQRNNQSQNMIQYPSKNVRAIMPAQNNMIEYPINSGWGGAGVSNRGGGGGFSNRGGSREMGNDFNNMGGGYSFNPNNNRYADDNFEDRFTQGLSGSGRKWFNRYIQKGFAPKIAREKALEHRTLPYLRDGPKSNQIANNAVANLPLPALENFGNKLMSLFSGNNAGGGGNFGGSANQMANFNSWGNNMQGFSNDFNTAGHGSSNYRSGNRNNDRALMPRRGGAAMNPNVRPNSAKGTGSGILDKMLAEIPSSKQAFVAKTKFYNSMTILEKLKKKTSKGLLNNQDVKDKQYHKQIVKEYQIWIRKQETPSATQTKKTDVVEKDKGITKPTTSNATKNLDYKSKSKEAARHKSVLMLAYEKNKKDLRAITNLDEEKTDKKWQEYEKHKRELLNEALLSNLKDPPRRLSGSRKRRMRQLQEKAGIDEIREAKTLAILPQEKLQILITLKTNLAPKTGKDIKDKLDIQQNIEKTFKNDRTSKTYDDSVKFLKKYEEHDLTTLSERELALIRICLRRKRRIDQEEGLPLATTRFDHLLTDDIDEDANTLNDNAENEGSNETQNKLENNADSVDITETAEKTETPKENNADSVDITETAEKTETPKENNQDIVDLTEE